MITLSLKTKLVLLSVVAAGIALFVIANFTSISQLEAVTLDNDTITEFESSLGLKNDAGILRQPIDSLTSTLLNREGVVKVDLEYKLPNQIDVKTNQFTPVCFALDRKTGRLVGLTDEGRVVPIPKDQQDWERPMITSVVAGKLYTYCDDIRVKIVIQQLKELKEDHRDLYRLVSDMDFSNPSYVLVTISGLKYKLKLSADDFAAQLKEFIRFIERFSPDLSTAKVLDMRFDNMIIQAEGKN